MIPIASTNQFTMRDDVSRQIKPWQTWRMELDGTRIRGNAPELDALNQTIYTLLRIERYKWPIFDTSVGLQMYDLYGMPKRYVFAMLTERIPETLLIDDRIIKVENFIYDVQNSVGHTLAIEYTVRSRIGDFIRGDLLNV